MYYETDYLAHYGVLGMKWGVRRYQNKDGSLTSEGKKRLHNKEMTEEQKKALRKKVLIGAAAATAILAVTGATVYTHKLSSYRTSINVNSLDLGRYKLKDFTVNDDLVIKKGSDIFRSSNRDTLRDGPVYLSINKKDRDRYIHRMSGMYKDLYQMKIKSTKDLKIPSEKKQMDMFVDLLEKDRDFSSAITRNPYGITKNVFGDRAAAQKFAEGYHYQNFITKMIDYDPGKRDTLSTFVDYVKSKGYDGLIDVNDIRTTSDVPIIALNKGDLIVESSKKVNAGMKFVSGLRLQNVKIRS